MPRIARVSVEGVPYHVTQRGNGRQRLFFSWPDYRLYLDLLRANANRYQLQIWAYCLMPNHVHLIVVPERGVAMAKALGRTHADYARHFNLTQRSCGHVWQARFFSCPMDRAHLWLAMAYVERNPVRAGLVEEARSYPWSSAAAHTRGEDPVQILSLGAWRKQYTVERWREVLRAGVAEEALAERLREATVRGRPLGGEGFLDELERKADRRLRPLPVGRPKKSEDTGGSTPPDAQLRLGIGI
ncbi:MAG: transposase [Bryobacteraceae bacterium]